MTKETLEVIYQALNERSIQLADIKNHGLTPAIRKAAEEDYLKTHKAWEEAEKELLNKEK